ncbi:MFS transporter [Dactylosporangium sp. CA-139066]|uniref:MFS transporter n=1 Tax=Dactylosporangium sp. CA-139066 TaxID=3239930 RepID=UPI003D8FCC26
MWNSPNQVFWRWWTAGAVSSAGSAVGAVALPLTALTALDASPVEMGFIAAAGYVAWLLIGMPAGVLVQRLPLRGAQVAADVVRAAAVASVPLCWYLGVLTVAQLIAVALCVSLANVVFGVANQTFLPAVVPPEQLQSRNSLNSATEATTQLGGPSAAGLLVQALGPVATLLVDAVSYLASAVLLRTLPPRRAGGTGAAAAPMRAMIGEGWRFVVRHPIMGPGLWLATAVNFVCGAQLALYPLYLVRELHTPAGWVGALLAAEGLGTLAGAALTPRFTARAGTARALVVASLVAVLGAMIIPVGTSWAAYAAFTLGNVVFAAGVVVLSVTMRTYRQLASPPGLLPRVVATVRFVSWGAIAVGGVLAGLAAGAFGARAALFAFAAATVLAPLAVLASPIRRLRDLDDYRAPQAVTDTRPATVP